ncbi:MAG: OmpA family protein [Rhodospirillales bacterium]|nr:OmpA family protein [Rhodospirillales bacterium]
MKILLRVGLVFVVSVWLSSTFVRPTVAEPLDADAIIKSLAPIKYLPRHGGQPKRAVDLEVQFKVNSAKLTARARRQLDALGQALQGRRLKSSSFEIVGHTDASGKASYNLTLSQRRATAGGAYLKKQHGIKTARLKAEGKGESHLKDPVNPRASANRRVEVINLNPVQVQAKPDRDKEINNILLGR